MLLLPTAFLIVERSSRDSWTPGSGLHATVPDARRTLAFGLTWVTPRQRGLIPYDAEMDVDAHTMVAENTGPAVAELAEFAEAAEQLSAGRLNEVEVHGTVSRIVRARRLLRWGPDGPGRPAPVRPEHRAPEALHPRLDEHGTVHFDQPAEGEAAS
ncbi:LigA protein OS=Streptomyces alboniger OX=132473 GN=CP975_28990 PE=4 SV=1 [Streptomyces alboniger]